MSEIEIEGEIEVGTSEEAAYAEVMEKLEDLDETLDGLSTNAITVNGEFDDTLGWWTQVQNGHRVKVGDEWITDLGDKRADSIIVHKRELTENYLNLDVSPAIVTQTTVSYNPTSTDGENFTRMASEYHELIGEGYCNATQDHSTPNFTAMGATCYNKFKGNVGMCAVIGRIDDVAYTDDELGISPNDTDGTTGMGSSKSCAGGFFVTRRANYSQGRHNASYSIGAETYALNAAEEDGILGTDGYPDNKDFHNFRSWTNALHLVGGGRRPATDGILINGFTVKVPIDANGKTTSDRNAVKRVTMHNGFLNGITIGGSSMAVRHIVKVTNANGDVLSEYATDGNSTETVGINTSSWSNLEGKNYGFYLLKHGYSGRILHSRGAALFEVPGAKFFNSTGSMPFAISCVNEYTYKDEQQVEHTAHGVPYLDFKIGSSSDFFQNNKPVERPTDTTRSRIGYVSTSNSMNLSSDGSMKFNVARDFSSPNTTGKIYTMTATDFSPSSPVNLGTSSQKWDNIYANADVITTSDRNFKTDIQDIDEKILRAWSKVNYKVFKFKNGSRKHIGVIAQDIDKAFADEGLDARDFGLFCEDTDDSGNKILGVRYSECLALECAYLRRKIGA